MEDVVWLTLLALAALAAVGALLWGFSSRSKARLAAEESKAKGEQLAALHREYAPLMADAARLQWVRAEAQRLEAAAAAAQASVTHTERAAWERASALEQEALARIAARERASIEDVRQREAAALASERVAATRLAELQRSVGALEEQADLQSMGFYRLRYDFDSSARYEERLEQVRERQKAMLKDGTAAVCAIQWHVDGDAKAGERMVRDQIKLMLRAFNGECDAAVAKVRYNNFTTLDRRMRADFEAVNKIGASKQCQVSRAYLDLKLEELALVFEYQERKQKEIEEQRAIREQMRDEERAAKELEAARREAEREEQRFEVALEKARREAEAATGRQRLALEQKVAELAERLAAATAKQKAISQAQLTSAGHVYVISNVGSFGEGVYKIGMTRRLDPMDRVIELGDASVPFPFDVHAMIHTENAPELERLLHQRFTARRVNLINERKEFFRVGLDDVERAVREIVAKLPRHAQREVTFTRTALAEEYRKSAALLTEREGAAGHPATSRQNAPAN
ncbi:MAG: DUF4041 domain-containing protein [Polyangiales bacterium]